MLLSFIEMHRDWAFYLVQAEYHIIGEREYEEEYEGGGCGPQAAKVIFSGVIYATQRECHIWMI